VQGEVVPAIIEVLKEAGGPLKAKVIGKKLDERNVTYSNLHIVLSNMEKQRPDIEKRRFGHYAYVGNPTE
jgi:hypothetical protein